MEITNNTTPDNVTVYRFIRVNESMWEDYDTIVNNNLYGITIRFDIDYVNRTVTAGWTICDGENFSKEVGRSLADNAYVKVQFNYVDVEIHRGLINALIENLNGMYPKYRVFTNSQFTTFQDKLELFRRALRED